MRKLFLFIAVFVMALCANAQTNQYFWYQGNLMMGNLIAQIDSVTFGDHESMDTLHVLLPRTIIKEVHDTVYIHDCLNLTDIWSGFIVEATEDGTTLFFNTRKAGGGVYYDSSIDCSAIEGNLWYSFDAQNWNEWICGDFIILNQGQKVCLKGNRPKYCIFDLGYYRLLISKGAIEGYGYITSLFDNGGQCVTTSYGDQALSNFFEGNCSIVLSFPEGVTDIGTSNTYSYSFSSQHPSGYEDKGFTSVELPSTLRTLGCTCFEGAPFKEITIPRAVTYIGNAAFNNCIYLETVNFLGTKTEWDAIIKGNYKWGSDVPASVVHCLDGDAPF